MYPCFTRHNMANRSFCYAISLCQYRVARFMRKCSYLNHLCFIQFCAGIPASSTCCAEFWGNMTWINIKRLPSLLPQNTIDMAITQSHHDGNGLSAEQRIQRTHSPYLLRRDFGLRILYPYQRTPFIFHIPNIVCLGTKEQVIRIDAGAVVATRAVMEYEQPVRNRATAQFPRSSMGSYASKSINMNTPITIVRLIANPYPAASLRFFANRSPKTYRGIPPLDAAMMPMEITQRLSAYNATLSYSFRGKLRRLSATALAQCWHCIGRHRIPRLFEESLYSRSKNTATHTGIEHIGQNDQFQPSRVVHYSIACAGGQA